MSKYQRLRPVGPLNDMQQVRREIDVISQAVNKNVERLEKILSNQQTGEVTGDEEIGVGNQTVGTQGPMGPQGPKGDPGPAGPAGDATTSLLFSLFVGG